MARGGARGPAQRRNPPDGQATAGRAPHRPGVERIAVGVAPLVGLVAAQEPVLLHAVLYGGANGVGDECRSYPLLLEGGIPSNALDSPSPASVVEVEGGFKVRIQPLGMPAGGAGLT